MNDREQLAWEAENGRKYAIAAFASGLLSLLSVVLLLSVGGASDDRGRLIKIHEHSGAIVGGAVAQGLAAVALGVVFFFLRRVIIARKVQTLSFLWPIVFLAPVILLVGVVIAQIDQTNVASTFVSGSNQTKDHAHDLIRDASKLGPSIAKIGGLAFAVSFVMIGVYCMRAGLMSKFMGILAAICGVLTFLGGGAGSFIQLFWTVAVGFLLIDRWPNKRGPAWDTVEAIPWPSAADLKGMKERPTDAPATVTAAENGDAKATPNPRAARRRKKKKKR